MHRHYRVRQDDDILLSLKRKGRLLMATNVTLVLDLGNSETRGIVLCGKDKNGKLKDKYFSLSNRFAEVAEDYVPSVDYTPDTSAILKVDFTVGDQKIKGCYANGELQLREFNIGPLRPSATEKKYTSVTTVLSFQLAVLRAYGIVKELMGDISADDIIWSVNVLLPPGDMVAGQQKMSDLIKSVTAVDSVYPKMSFKVNIKQVVVLPEGFCAYIATVYDKGNVIRKDAKSLLKEATLVFDIGAGTTDVLVVKDNKIINSTMHSIERGGNNVQQLVKKSMRTECDNLRLPESEIAQGLIDGYVKDGSRTVDITEFVNSARDSVASYLISDLQSYLEETELSPRSINKVLICGGGAINKGGCKALSEAIVFYLKRLAPYVELVALPKDTVTGEELSPRVLNVRGASILAAVMK